MPVLKRRNVQNNKDVMVVLVKKNYIGVVNAVKQTSPYLNKTDEVRLDSNIPILGSSNLGIQIS